MERLRRWALNRLTVISLACFITAMPLWIRSYWIPDTIEWSNDSNGRMTEVYWVQSDFDIEYLSGNIPWGIPPGIHFYKDYCPDIEAWATPKGGGWVGWSREFLGISFSHANRVFRVFASDRFSETDLVIPLWIIAIAAGILPALTGARYFRTRKQTRKGLCAHCGYDLRATPDRCPECGRAVEATV